MAADAGPHTTLFGLEVTDDAGYTQYRSAMAPILARHGGAFGCDFVVARVLKGPNTRINRVFTLTFPSSANRDRFFADLPSSPIWGRRTTSLCRAMQLRLSRPSFARRPGAWALHEGGRYEPTRESAVHREGPHHRRARRHVAQLRRPPRGQAVAARQPGHRHQ